jgi:hypothetical protein
MQNGFRPWIRALGEIDWRKNRGSKISCYCPFKKSFLFWNQKVFVLFPTVEYVDTPDTCLNAHFFKPPLWWFHRKWSYLQYFRGGTGANRTHILLHQWQRAYKFSPGQGIGVELNILITALKLAFRKISMLISIVIVFFFSQCNEESMAGLKREVSTVRKVQGNSVNIPLCVYSLATWFKWIYTEKSVYIYFESDSLLPFSISE